MKKFFVVLIFSFGMMLVADMAFAACPSGYPVDCGDGWCCKSGQRCGGDGKCYDKNPTCPSHMPINCGDGYCCQSGFNCCSGGGCCPGDKPIGCAEQKSCYTNFDAARKGGCKNPKMCGVPK